MDIIELTQRPMQKIASLYQQLGAEFNAESLQNKLRGMQIVPAEIGDEPISYNQRTNVLKLDAESLEGYDLEYHLTTYMLLMLNEFSEPLLGIRTGLCAGIAAGLVGNCIKETENEVVPGVDSFESLRAGIADLGAKITPDRAIALCAAGSLEEFISLAGELGIEDPKKFLETYNYLALNAGNLSEVQITGLTEELAKNNSTLTQQEAKVIG